MILALRHPEDVRGLLLWRVTGGQYAATRLSNQYYASHIAAAQSGGMAAVCAMEHWSEVIEANPASRDKLMAMDPQDFIARMTRWGESFDAGSDHAVTGLSPADLRSITVPACVVPGNDRVHPRTPGQAAHRLMPNSEYREVFTEDRMDVDVAFEDWEAKEGLLAAIFIDFLRRQGKR
jgi:pimeloyl-ACP methyl ester carboxylesterase